MNTTESRQIAQLSRELSRLGGGQPKRKNKKPKPRRAGASAGKSKEFDPIHSAIRARFVPFDTEKGIAAPMADGRPSQKFMAKAQAQIALGIGQGFCYMACPNVASNASYASIMFAVGTFTNGRFAVDGAWKNATGGTHIGPFGATSWITTNTPYDAATLTHGFEYSCVGSGLKFTYEGSELYRGGTMRYLYDKEGAYNAAGDWTADTVNGLIDYVNSAPNTVRQSINKENVVEINTSNIADGYYECGSPVYTTYGVGSNECALIGGTSATTYFGIRPNVLGYFVNTSGAAISFHVDVVEHWSISAATIQSLQTPSYAHAPMSTHVAALMDNVRQTHAGVPNTKHIDVAKMTMSALKSPLGHELLNAGIRAALF